MTAAVTTHTDVRTALRLASSAGGNLNKVRLSAKGGELTVIGGNPGFLIRAITNTQGRAKGDLIVPAGILHRIAGRLSEKAAITVGKIITISDEETEYILDGFDGADFLEMPVMEQATSAVLPRSLVQGVSSLVAPYAATDESRPILTAVYSDEHHFVSADGFRLGRLTHDAEGLRPLMLPTVAYRTALRLGGDITLSTEGDWVMLQGESGVIACQPIIGTYPDYEKLMPKEDGRAQFTLAAADLNRALRLVEPVANEGAQIVRAFHKGGKLSLISKSDGLGSITATIPTASDCDDEFRFALNLRFFKELARTCPTERLHVSVKSQSDPVLFRPVGGNIEWVVMPMFVVWN